MPELPEVESTRRDIAPVLLGVRVRRVTLRRADIVTGSRAPGALLQGCVIGELRRRGKQLAIVSEQGSGFIIHLGMSGRLFIAPGAHSPGRHDHVTWSLGARELVLCDPRRFGGVRTFESPDALERLWADLGPDALSIDDAHLAQALSSTRRSVKLALLDQRVLAGVGNIYADESLFAAGVHPARRADGLQAHECLRLSASIRDVLDRAVRAGGSTLRDGTYVRSDGSPGSFQGYHRVYARGGLPCLVCGQTLLNTRLAQRTTVWCPSCQTPTPARRRGIRGV